MRVSSFGQALCVLTMIALGVMGLVSGHFAPIWASVPKDAPMREALVYLTAVVSLVSGVGLLVKRTDVVAALALFATLFVWMVLFKVSVIVRNPAVPVAYESWGETAVLVAAAWALFAERSEWPLLGGAVGVRLAQLLFGLALVAFGIAHFAYADLTASLVPKWLPEPLAWAALTGVTYLLAGAAILTGVMARLAAALVTLQVAGFTALVWGPFVITGHPDAGQWSEFVVSFAITAAALVITESFSATG